MKKIGLSLATVLFLSACANQAKLERSTAFAMGVNESQVQVSNISRDMSGTKYNAKINGQMYNCSVYGGTVTSFGAMTTPDCVAQSGSGKPTRTKSCNDLLKAAGKCK